MAHCFVSIRKAGINISSFFLLLLSCFTAKSQITLFSEGFETNLDIPAGWSKQNYSGGNQWNAHYSWDHYSGNYSAGAFPNTPNTNVWLFSPAQQLQAGKTYILSYYTKSSEDSRYKITLNNSADYAGQVKTLRTPVNVTNWTQFKDTFACEVSGIYYIGFNNYSTASSSASCLIDDVNFVQMDYVNCSSLTAGTISSPVSSICPGVEFTLTNTNATQNETGIRYSWQKSLDGINWTNITNGYSNQPGLRVSQTVATRYRLVDTCTVSGNSAVSNVLFIDKASFLTCYCMPALLNCSNLQFTNVTILNSTINNNASCSANGYGNYTSLGTPNAYRNQTINIKTTVNAGSNLPHQIGVWIDTDHSGTFDEDEFFKNTDLTQATNITQVMIPADALLGTTRIRVKLKYSTPANFMSYQEACTNNPGSTGQIHDYQISITDPPNCSGPVSAGTISAVSQICPNTSFVITATGATFQQGQMRYAWQKSTDNINWTTISNTSYIINPLTVSQNTNTYYRLTDTCTVSGQSAISNVISVSTNNLFSCYCTPVSMNCSTYSIDSVSFNTIRNQSGCSGTGYTNYTGISTSINNGSNVNIFLRFKTTSLTKYAGVWIDFNRNGKYEQSENVFTGSTNGNTLTGAVNVPFNISGGETGMRVMVGQYLSDVVSCNTYAGNGEVEDYRIILNIINPVVSKFSYYVKGNATGANDGSNWANAFTSLSTAFTYAKTGDTIKVAKGVYTAGTLNSHLLNLKDSIVMLGGYPDTGNPSNANRDFSQHQTILSGEIGNTASSDNTYTILQAAGIKGFIVDGFIIEKGYQQHPNFNGALYFTNSTGTLKNTVIRNNLGYGTAFGINIQNSTISLINNIIESNTIGEQNDQSAVINIVNKSDVNIINCVVAKNKSVQIIRQKNSQIKVVNSTFFKNYGFNSVLDTSNLIVQNSIFHYNGNNFDVDTAEFQKDIYSTLGISNSMTDIYQSDGTVINNPKFVDTARIAGADNKYFNGDDGLQLLNPCSPGINTGNNTFAAALNTDITGSNRIRNGVVDLGAYEIQNTVASTPSVLYVNKAATGQNNGLTWQDAFTDLQVAFNNCSDTIKVAKGTYPVSTTDGSAYYLLSNNRVVIGGFSGTGSSGNGDFDPNTNRTIIDGAVNSTTKCPVLVVSRGNDSTAQFIGFELINSLQPELAYQSDFATLKVQNISKAYFESIRIPGGKNEQPTSVLISRNSSPVFVNSAFYNGHSENTSSVAGQIVITGNSNPRLLKCYFGKDTSSSLSGTKGVSIFITNSTGLIDSCLFFRAGNHAIYNSYSSPIIQNTLFRKNSGRSLLNDASNPLIYNCIFADTVYQIEQDGGTMANINGSEPVFDKCYFYDSYSLYNGGTCYNLNSQPLFKNCLFKGTQARGLEGSVFYNKNSKLRLVNSIVTDFNDRSFLSNNENSASTIINSTIVATAGAQPMISSGGTSSIKLYNSIIWRYAFGLIYETTNNDIATGTNSTPERIDIRNSILFRQKNTPMTNSTEGIDPKLFDISNLTGADRLLRTADDGFKPCDCSPAINAGDNSLIETGYDISGTGRIYNGTVDIGAYELQSSPTKVKTVYVKQSAPAGGDGQSWTTAYNDLQKAIQNNCADTIRIAKGIYKPATASRDSSFNIYSPVAIFGGYPDSGNPGQSDRNIHTYPTILSGDIGIPNDSTDNLYSVVKVHCPDSTVILDGLIIEKGNANQSSGNGSQGGGILATGNARLLINNCIIRNNYGTRGGGLYSSWSNITVSKTVMTNNTSQYYGGGFYMADGYMAIAGLPWQPNVQFKNSVVAYNNGMGGLVDGSGAGLYRNLLFENVIFYKNNGYPGAGLLLKNNPGVRIINCHFVKNNITTYNSAGASILVQGGGSLATYVANSLFKGSTVAGGTNGYLNGDFNWQSGGSAQLEIPPQNLDASAFEHAQTGTDYETMPGSNNLWFRDIDNGPGPDGIWMTEDDGLQVTNCAVTIDRGINSVAINLPTDILDSARIQNQRIDIGAYESAARIARITTADSIVCPGTMVTFTASEQNIGASAVYQWQVNGINVGTNSNTYSSPAFVNGDRVQVKIKKADCTVNDTTSSNIIIMSVGTALTPVARITASDTTICAGKQITFNATATQVNSGSLYQWTVNNINAGTNSPVFTTTSLSEGDIVKVTVTVNGTCLATQNAISNSIKIHVNPNVTPSVSIAASAASICAGSAVTYTATPVNGGSSPSFQWKVNGINTGTNSPLFSASNLANNDVVTVVMSSSAGCAVSQSAISNAISQPVSSQTAPAVTISTTGMTCPGSSVTLTANAVNGGTNPVFEWKLNGQNVGTTSSTYESRTLKEGDKVEVILTSNASCLTTSTANSTPLTIHFTSGVTPAVSITSSATSICEGATVTFSATATHGGTTPSYDWFVNNIRTGSNSPVFTTNTLRNNDNVTVLMTSSATCTQTSTALSNSIIMNVSPIGAPSVTITASKTTICTGATVEFTASATNGGPSPVFQWKKNGTNVGTGSSYTSNSFSNGDIINCVLTTSSACATTPTTVSNNITITVTPIPAAPAISANGPLTFCSGGSVILTSSASAGNQWYKDGGIISGATNTTYTATSGGVYTVTSTVNGCLSAASAGTTVSTNAPPATPLITATDNLLSTASGMNSYQWYLNSGAINNATDNTYTATSSGLYKVEVSNAQGCKAMSAELNFAITAVGNATVNGVEIVCFPSPATTELNIRLSGIPFEKPAAQLMDNTGRVLLEFVLNQQVQTIDVSRLAGGFYILNVIGKKGKAAIKVEIVR